MTGFDARKAARVFADLRRSKSASLRVPDDVRPGDISQGYELQAALGLILQSDKGARCGHKIGCTTPVMQNFLNIDHPCAGLLYENEVHDKSVTLHLSDFVGVGVECEIALRLGQDLTPQDAPYTKDQVAGAVDQIMAAAEIVDNRYLDFHDFGIPSLIADDFFSGGAVLGAGNDPSGIDVPSAKGTTFIDDREVGTGFGKAVMGHPFNALAWLANQKAERGEILKAGDIIMTGSVVETQWITEPCVVRCSVEPLGQVMLTFV